MHMDEKRLVELMEQVLDARRRIDADTHAEHHSFVQLLIDERRVRKERWEKVRSHVYGWGIITAITGIGASLWHLIEKNFGK